MRCRDANVVPSKRDILLDALLGEVLTEGGDRAVGLAGVTGPDTDLWVDVTDARLADLLAVALGGPPEVDRLALGTDGDKNLPRGDTFRDRLAYPLLRLAALWEDIPLMLDAALVRPEARPLLEGDRTPLIRS